MGSSSDTRHNKDAVTMIGLDFGSTTSSAIVAHALVARSSATGRMTFGAPEIRYRSEPVFTPFKNNQIDETLLQEYLDQWLQESGIVPEQLFAGGAIITGLATEADNAGRITQLVKKRVGEAIIATASDPCLESWLAFMGSCSALSRCNPDHPIINLDIGGGTTNPAFGKNGAVLATGCYFIGARHFQFNPGTYTLTAISAYGQILIRHLGIAKTIGETLTAVERDAILDFYLDLLESIVCDNSETSCEPTTAAHTQVPLTIQRGDQIPIVTFSGGVGELIYQYSMGKPLPSTTHFGDLGVDLATRIARSPLLASSITDFVPENMGRATVYGLAIHSTEISGATLFLPNHEILPLQDLPIVGKITMEENAANIEKLLILVARNRGGAIQIVSSKNETEKPAILQGPFVEKHQGIKSLGQKVANILQAIEFAADTPLVLLAPGNFGKSLGNYATNWKKLSLNLVVIDEISDRNAHFVNIGRIHNNIVPVSFYGVQ
ncbi:MAG: ethanolamine utilization protein EutA [Desulforhopalus sp.]